MPITIWTAPGSPLFNNGDSGLTLRGLYGIGFANNVALTSGNNGGDWPVRVTFKADSSNGNWQVDHASIGVSTGVGSNTTATPVELKFGGASGFIVAQGTSITSDWVLIPAFTTSNVLVVIYDQTTGNNSAGILFSSATASLYLKSGVSYNVAVPPGMGSANNYEGVASIEVLPPIQGACFTASKTPAWLNHTYRSAVTFVSTPPPVQDMSSANIGWFSPSFISPYVEDSFIPRSAFTYGSPIVTWSGIAPQCNITSIARGVTIDITGAIVASQAGVASAARPLPAAIGRIAPSANVISSVGILTIPNDTSVNVFSAAVTSVARPPVLLSVAKPVPITTLISAVGTPSTSVHDSVTIPPATTTSIARGLTTSGGGVVVVAPAVITAVAQPPLSIRADWTTTFAGAPVTAVAKAPALVLMITANKAESTAVARSSGAEVDDTVALTGVPLTAVARGPAFAVDCTVAAVPTTVSASARAPSLSLSDSITIPSSLITAVARIPASITASGNDNVNITQVEVATIARAPLLITGSCTVNIPKATVTSIARAPSSIRVDCTIGVSQVTSTAVADAFEPVTVDCTVLAGAAGCAGIAGTVASACNIDMQGAAAAVGVGAVTLSGGKTVDVGQAPLTVVARASSTRVDCTIGVGPATSTAVARGLFLLSINATVGISPAVISVTARDHLNRSIGLLVGNAGLSALSNTVSVEADLNVTNAGVSAAVGVGVPDVGIEFDVQQALASTGVVEIYHDNTINLFSTAAHLTLQIGTLRVDSGVKTFRIRPARVRVHAACLDVDTESFPCDIDFDSWEGRDKCSRSGDDPA
jgi:hypothetical protein